MQRAKKLIVSYLTKYAMARSFFVKARNWCVWMYAIQERLSRQILRRRHKTLILREYWRAVIDRCSRLDTRGQSVKHKKFQGHRLVQISE